MSTGAKKKFPERQFFTNCKQHKNAVDVLTARKEMQTVNEYKYPSFHRTQTRFPHYTQIIVGIGTEFSRHLSEATVNSFLVDAKQKK